MSQGDTILIVHTILYLHWEWVYQHRYPSTQFPPHRTIPVHWLGALCRAQNHSNHGSSPIGSPLPLPETDHSAAEWGDGSSYLPIIAVRWGRADWATSVTGTMSWATGSYAARSSVCGPDWLWGWERTASTLVLMCFLYVSPGYEPLSNLHLLQVHFSLYT